MPIRAVIFDLDGTITQPYFDFDAIRAEIGLSKDSGPVLEALEGMTAEERHRAEKILHYHEDKALIASQLNPGARETLQRLRDQGVHIGILTRNRKRNAQAIAERHALQFDAVVGREDGPVKPDAFGVRHLCRHFGVRPSQTLLVGDYLFDLQCARAAGAVPVLIANHPQASRFAAEADFQVTQLSEILQIIEHQAETDAAQSPEEGTHV